jgi:hypothetical protein
MSFADTLFQQTPVMAVPFSHLLTGLIRLTLLGGVLMFFRPLLIGIVRALVLVVRPRPTKDQLAARRKLQAGASGAARADGNDLHVLGSR